MWLIFNGRILGSLHHFLDDSYHTVWYTYVHIIFVTQSDKKGLIAFPIVQLCVPITIIRGISFNFHRLFYYDIVGWCANITTIDYPQRM